MAKRPLKAIDYTVLRALRWTWWSQAQRVMGYNDGVLNVNQVNIDHHMVLHTLRAAHIPEFDYGDAPKVSYRLRKLVEYGLVRRTGGRNSDYAPTATSDPYIHQLVDDQKKHQEAVRAEKESARQWIKTTLDQLVPGNEMEVSFGYGSSKTKSIMLNVTAPYSHLRIVLKLAQMQVEAQDREAEQYE